MLKGSMILMKKELSDYFSSPLIYIIAGVFSLIMGLLFYNFLVTNQELTNLSLANSILLPTFGAMNFLLMFIVPLLTMGHFAEESKNETLDLILRSDLSVVDIIIAKFLSTFFVVLFLVMLTLVFPIILSFSGYDQWAIVWTNYGAVLLSVCAYIAVGLFASSITENQIVSVVVSFSVLFAFLLLINMSSVTENYIVGMILQYFSIGFHHAHLSKGMVVSFNLVYYVSFVGFFSFLTYKSLDSRNW
ncbi:ABC transporter permease [Halobacteriovorax sp. GB3]|uniref:ABC transporter permease n=1 Tax=Halobacteriovorax sp. GB3 TaxID=2719615 RepID=UPI0023613597|nr:ABC transporter permease [Halobacteriovorax sp. GB3]MDD0851567.1 ABC transporter permease [Halobacteriovorax sp. GB3]